ncbi:hypothetical protein Leryth_001632 [Lithospermum erythrorhizon]|uniref:Jacalin-type lectin domain-containing protein n=1 Tax=Lithospermum erythrorhizon TaxID=34254 RepID=A0AAV3NTC6_LITER|nr:hypothetical protein Leryth_001632 [Lithospermum erythrorhizon]
MQSRIARSSLEKRSTSVRVLDEPKPMDMKGCHQIFSEIQRVNFTLKNSTFKMQDFKISWIVDSDEICLPIDMEHETPKAIVVGPWGGLGGAAWDDGSFTGVREITLVYGRCIDSMKVVYDKNGQPFPTPKHGGAGGSMTAEIKLQFPDEFLTSVSGYWYPVVHGGSPIIRSLTFKSNRSTFGPYGVEEGIPFSFPMEGGKIVGFKGKSGWYLDSIGFHITQAHATKSQQIKYYPVIQTRFRRMTF